MKLSEYVQTNCCGTTCNKGGLVKRIAELEAQLEDANEIIGSMETTEAFAEKCFKAGYDRGWGSGYAGDEPNSYHEFLNFKVTVI